ncbi:hypothetical protein C497_14517 [Halalkalicoccus jeotgali B3]|uniref:Uncharacterized protein n=1 Tax=Halalkalicoccus jeotgali (strain DSM 18796 / CECT 7217 / JCM 14584 / KCTC 4019 / B3) TaxID=795797 RepID=L9VD47_HALJB|nr:hypothetical protein C497_14517 [Halalkalicoccus jeotgali B3]
MGRAGFVGRPEDLGVVLVAECEEDVYRIHFLNSMIFTIIIKMATTVISTDTFRNAGRSRRLPAGTPIPGSLPDPSGFSNARISFSRSGVL